MPAIPSTGLVATNGVYTPAKKYTPGKQVVTEVTGTFASGTITPGWMSTDSTPVFVADGSAVTAAGRVTLRVPKSGIPAFTLASATGSTAIKLAISTVR